MEAKQVTKIQQLAAAAYRLSEAGAAGPSSCELERAVTSLMDAITPADLGLPPGGPLPSHAIRTQSIVHSDAFELVIFLLPAGAHIPLHDHPGMTVFTKVLSGALAMRAFDFSEPQAAGQQHAAQSAEAARLASAAGADAANGAPLTPPYAAVPCADTVLTDEAPTAVLRPRFANVHAFDAARPAVVLDLLMPPYSFGVRDCHYFEASEAEGRPTLRVVASPPDLIIRGATYEGPAVALPESEG